VIERSALDVKGAQRSRKMKTSPDATHDPGIQTRAQSDSEIDEKMFAFNYEHSSNSG
jgi:hypothetical protein